MSFNNKILLKNEKYLYFNQLNARDIQIYAPNLIHELDENNNIIKIHIPYVYELKVGEVFEYLTSDNKKVVYDVKYISKFEHKENSYIVSSHIRNQTTIYLLPTLGLLPIEKDIKDKYSSDYIKEMERFGVNSYLINAYLNKQNKTLKLIYKFSHWETYIDLESQLKNHKNFLQLKDEKSRYVSVYYSIPEEFYNDIELFINGKYSQLSKELKYRILNFLKLKEDKQNIVKMVLTKDEKLKSFIQEILAISSDYIDELDDKPSNDDYYE